MKIEEHEQARLKVEEGVHLALEAGRIAEEEQHIRLKAKEEARLVEEARLKSKEKYLRLKSEDKAHLVEEARLKYEQEEQAHF